LQKFPNKKTEKKREKKREKGKEERAEGELFDPDKKSAHSPACTPARIGILSFLFLC
jgi:hypothetical protein